MNTRQRRERERQELRSAILKAAREIAARDGWSAVTIRRVADQIEYSPAMIYEYFESKEAMLLTLIREGLQAQLAALRAQTSTSDPSLRILNIAASYCAFAWQHPELYQLIYDLKAVHQEVPEAKQLFLTVREAIQTWAQATGAVISDLDAAVDILWAMLHGLVSLTMAHWMYGGSERADLLVKQAVGNLLLAWRISPG